MINIEKMEAYNKSFWNARYEADDGGRGMIATGTHIIFVAPPVGEPFFMLVFVADMLNVGVAVIDDDNINFMWKC